jgi:hypothetical protein
VRRRTAKASAVQAGQGADVCEESCVSYGFPFVVFVNRQSIGTNRFLYYIQTLKNEKSSLFFKKISSKMKKENRRGYTVTV